ncbi:MAG: hypothetical protein V1766_09515 [Pseudomonadota bacterium]
MTVEKPIKSNDKSNDNNKKRVYRPATSRVHLKTYEDCRRLLSTLINDLRQLKVDPAVGRAAIYGCSVLLQVFELKLLETDIRELQEIAKERYG